MEQTVDKEAILDVLETIKDYFENKADADHDENGYVPNVEMRHSAELTLVIQQVASLIKERDELKISLEMAQLGWNGTIDKKEEWENQAKALSAVKKGLEFMIYQQNTTINELTASNEAKEKEIERLKGLIKSQF